MTLSMPDPSALCDRTLPKPTALLQTLPTETLTRRGYSVSQHHLVPRTLSQEVRESDPSRRRTVPCISYLEKPQSIAATRQARTVDSTAQSISLSSQLSRGLLAQKREACEMVEEPHSGPSTPSSLTLGESAKDFCLCQPDPKIPRPRNAFILYRQHQHAAVVVQHPGMPNPEISKIIGEQWRSLPVKSKNEWKALAEEEKARHQQQYPDYRYQPRRNGRYSGSSSISGPFPSQPATVSEQGTCLKCLGKVMNPPNTPYTPHPPNTPGAPPPGMMSTHPPRRAYTVNGRPQNTSQMSVATASPHPARVRQYADVFGRQPGHDPHARYFGQQAPPPNPASPNQDTNKRRRFNGHGILIPDRGEMHPQQHQQYSTVERPTARPEMLQHPRTNTTPQIRSAYPPPSAPPQSQTFRFQHPAPPRDPSLVLPPLKTVTSQTQGPPIDPSQKSGLEAMIRSIPSLNKLRFLAQIAPALARPSLASPPHEVRGAILAVEGLDAASVWNMTVSLAEQLNKDGNFIVEIFRGPDPYDTAHKTGGGSRKDNEAEMSMETFLATIGQWHRISKEMIEWITTKPKAVNLEHTNCAREGREPRETQNEQEDTHMADTNGLLDGASDDSEPTSAVSPRTISKAAHLSLASPMPRLPTATQSTSKDIATVNGEDASSCRIPSTAPISSTPRAHSPSSSTQPAHPAPRTRTNASLIPIALVPHYQLTTVDTSAMALPITDSYSPLSHWQWLATLWRGCVGPDVCIVVEDVNQHENPRSSISAEGTSIEAREGVEVRLQDAKAIVVRLDLGKPGATVGEGWEKAKRRVGFEVEEFFRK